MARTKLSTQIDPDILLDESFEPEESFRYSRRESTRNKIIFGDSLKQDENYQDSQYRRFEDLTFAQFKQLIARRFVDPAERQNSAPNVLEFYRFLTKYPQFTLDGYIIGGRCDDYRVTLDGIGCTGASALSDAEFIELLIDFIRLAKYPDDLLIDRDNLYAWWD